MGDSSDGSSSAAHGALQNVDHKAQDNTDGKKGGFLSRIIGVLSPSDAADQAPLSSLRDNAGAQPLVPGMVNLRRMRLDDVMIPSAEITAVPADTTKKDLVDVFRESGLTRLPVYEGTLDTPIGLVHLKDFALTHGFNGKGERYNLKELLRPLLYAPPSMPIGVLLQKMQAERIHMALVIDEYGGVDGLVTLEDLVEQVIGEIEDEHDQAEGVQWEREGPGCYLAEARAQLDEFEAEIGMRLRADGTEEEEVDTLGGLVSLLAGHVPARGEVIVHPSGVEYEVVDADPRRIKRLRIRLPGQKDG
ncbi:MAG TPA: HlyC/CorC family transporter [Aliiroseovarius sp.]|nr:HlyC/CorC family transporter [Aliiroseovarius sp.]